MWEQNKKRVSQCIKFLTRELDKTNSEKGILNSRSDRYNLTGILLELTMYLSEFNFYPSELTGKCCEVAFFTSLLGDRWNLEKKEKISFFFVATVFPILMIDKYGIFSPIFC